MLRGEGFEVVGVDGDADAVAGDAVADDGQSVGGVGEFDADGVALDGVAAHQGVAGLALADVDAGVGLAGGVRALDDAAARVEGVDAVQAVVVGGDAARAEALDDGEAGGVQRVVGGAAGAALLQLLVGDAGEQDAVGQVAVDGEVLDDRPGAGDGDAVDEAHAAVEDHGVAVGAAQHDPGPGDADALAVGARVDQHGVAFAGDVHGLLDGREVLRDSNDRAFGVLCVGRGRTGRRTAGEGGGEGEGGGGEQGGDEASERGPAA